MSASAKPSESSMDDILASIRRIISDDEPAPRPLPNRAPERAPGRARDAQPAPERAAPQAAPRSPDRPVSFVPRRPAASQGVAPQGAAPSGAPSNGAAHPPRADWTTPASDPWIERPISGALGDAFDGLDRD
ncbi:MAG: hypothetical protein AB1592_17785, partial [Pseudomonadota bacterium]